MKKRNLIRITAMILALVLFTIPAMAAANPVVEARNGVVRILALFEDSYSTGSGFGVGEAGEITDLFVTSRHVITDEFGNRPVKIYILLDDYAFTHTGIDESRAVPCSIRWMSDDGLDLAVLETAAPVEGRVALPLCDNVSDTMKPTDALWVLGYPGSGDYMGMVSDEEFTTPADIDSVNTSNGSFSKFEREASTGTMTLVHNADMNGGNSGGPTVNEKGAVIGVNTFVFGDLNNTTETAQSASISVEEVIRVLDREGIEWEAASNGAGWIIAVVIAVILLAAGAAAVIFLKKKNAASAPAAAAPVIHEAAAAPQTVPAAAPKSAPVSNDSGLRFQALSGVFAGKRFAINGTVRMGRNPETNDFVYPAGTQGISGSHCSLIFAEGKLYLKDEGSTYGTFLANGQRLAARQAVELQPGDKFYLATTNETFIITKRGGM